MFITPGHEPKCQLDLPPELWLKVGNFLPEKELAKLWTLSRVFLEQHLNTKYRKARIFSCDHDIHSARRYLFHLLSPHIIHRIRCLAIASVTFRSKLPSSLQRQSRKYRIARKLPFSLGARIHPSLKTPDIFELVRRIIANLPPEANALEIQGYHCLTKEFFDMTSFAWNTMSNRLRQLHIMGSWDELVYLLKSTSSLPSLESLSLCNVVPADLRHATFALESDPHAIKHCTTFLQSLAPSLRDFKIKLSHIMSPPVILFLPQLLDSLRVVPELRILKVVGVVQMIESLGPSLRRFIVKLSGSLEQLIITPHPGISMEGIVLNNLRHITIIPELYGRPEFDQAPRMMLTLAQPLISTTHTLTSLILGSCPYFLSELAEFIGSEQICSILLSLTYLDIYTVSISPELLKLLANTLINLRDLKLTILVIIPDAALEHSRSFDRWGADLLKEDEWEPSFQTQEPISWRLQYLEIHECFHMTRLASAVENKLKGHLKRIIPSLEYIVHVT